MKTKNKARTIPKTRKRMMKRREDAKEEMVDGEEKGVIRVKRNNKERTSGKTRERMMKVREDTKEEVVDVVTATRTTDKGDAHECRRDHDWRSEKYLCRLSGHTGIGDHRGGRLRPTV